MPPSPRPRPFRRLRALLPLFLAACASGPVDQQGRPIVTLPPLPELAKGHDPFGIELGQPVPDGLLRELADQVGDPGSGPLLRIWSTAPNDGKAATVRQLGAVNVLRVFAAGPQAPVTRLEFFTAFGIAAGPDATKAATGLSATHIVGVLETPFRGKPDELYGGHVYETTGTCTVYATDQPESFLLVQAEPAYAVGARGDLYGIVRAASAAALAGPRFTPVDKITADVEAALVGPPTEQPWVLCRGIDEPWTAELRPLLARAAAARDAVRDGARAAFAGQLAALQQRWRQRPPGDLTQLQELLAAIVKLRHDNYRFVDVDQVGNDEARSLAADAPHFAARRWFATAKACELAAAHGRILTAHALLGWSFHLDGAADPATFWTRENEATQALSGDAGRLWQQMTQARRLAAGEVFARSLGTRTDRPGYLALLGALRAATEPVPADEFAFLTNAVEPVDAALHDPAGTSMVAALDAFARLANSPLRQAVRANLTELGRAHLRGLADAAAAAGEPCLAARHRLAIHAIGGDRWPEPENLLAVLQHGSQATDEDLRIARNLLAPVLARLLPPFAGDSLDRHHYEPLFSRPPVAEWPAFWQLGLSVDSLGDLGAAWSLVEKKPAPGLRTQLADGDPDTTRIVAAEVTGFVGSGALGLDGFAGLFLPPELAAEARQLADERRQLDADKAALDPRVAAINAQSAALDEEIVALNKKVEARTATHAEVEALRQKKAALDRERDALRPQQPALNARIDDYNRRLMRHNDARMAHRGREQGKYEQRVLSGVLGWIAAHSPELGGSAAEAAMRAAWLQSGAQPTGVARRPSRGHGNRLFSFYEQHLLQADGSKGIGQRLADAFVVLAGLETDAAARKQRFAPLVEEYSQKLGIDALYDHAAMVLPLDLVPAFGQALPDEVRQKIRAKADAAVRKAAEEQQRSMRR